MNLHYSRRAHTAAIPTKTLTVNLFWKSYVYFNAFFSSYCCPILNINQSISHWMFDRVVIKSSRYALLLLLFRTFFFLAISNYILYILPMQYARNFIILHLRLDISLLHGARCLKYTVRCVGIHSENNNNNRNNLLYHDSLNFYFSTILQNSPILLLLFCQTNENTSFHFLFRFVHSFSVC